MSKADCMFQYAVSYQYLSTDIVEDTDLITLEEAKALWHKYLPDFIRHHEEDNPEMVIWINCQDNADYGDTLAWIDKSSVVEGDKVYQVIKKEITI